ncbi:MAG: HDOD domain-containing protein [Chloroflexi bacterium]|jgi:putative nucleotidyltransferase with HDIG domain|nr:HDOD domain-containing protein [Chloroflexota bacterium]
MYTLKEIIEQLINIRRLPTLNPVVVMVEKALNAEEPDVQGLSRVISDDPSLTSMLLKVANSALYGARREITTVQEAVVRLGFTEVRKLVMDISVVNYVADMPEGLLNPIKYWEHSIGVAICMEQIQNMTRVMDKNGPQSHVVGLLHDIGRLISSTHLKEAYESLPDNPDELGSDWNIIEIERDRMGIDHAQIGAAVLDRWGLPTKIVNCVRYHHEPEVCPAEQRKQTYLLSLSDAICRKMQVGGSSEGCQTEIPKKLWTKLGLDEGILEEVEKKITDQIQKSLVLLNISGMQN